MPNARIAQLRALIEKDPNNPLGRYGLANEYFKSEMYKDAIEEIEEYLQLKDDEGAVYRMLAECYMRTGNIENAKESYAKGIEAANRHGHPSMAEEFEESIEFLDE
ncbi:MAG: tetratricopeptide repeat protein [Thermodesulfobacteriota bacterium]|jgi:predicted Zn-dependent protease